jgi:hypothetical protein
VTHSKVRDHLPVVLESNWHQKSGVKTKEKKLYSPAHPWRHLRALAAKKTFDVLGTCLILDAPD